MVKGARPAGSAVAGAERAVRQAVRISGFAGITAALLPLYAARDRLTREPDRARVRDIWVRRWSGSLLRLFGIHVTCRGCDAPVPSQSAPGLLVVANHRSALDVGILLRKFGGHMLSRGDLSKWPLVGAAARSVGTIFVDRASRASGALAIRAVRDRLKAGETVLVFPEGTTFEGDTVRPFQAGAFSGALKTGAAVVPVGIAYETGGGAAFVGESFTRHLARLAASGPTRVFVRIGAPIPVAEGARAADVARDAMVAVQALVDEARREVDAPAAPRADRAHPPPTR